MSVRALTFEVHASSALGRQRDFRKSWLPLAIVTRRPLFMALSARMNHRRTPPCSHSLCVPWLILVSLQRPTNSCVWGVEVAIPPLHESEMNSLTSGLRLRVSLQPRSPLIPSRF
ncbi:hypothetical protein B0H11DRAFT_2234028 [Mycena galericulata]|nr:hypothetical protein B0H11DRAFT_2234028 [Mycena galericulata]